MKRALISVLVGLAFCACGAEQKGTKEPSQEEIKAPGHEASGPSGPDTEGLMPDEQFVFHLAEIVNLIRESWGSCDQALRLCLAYIEKHKESIDEGFAYGKSKESELAGEAKAAYDQKMKTLLLELIPDFDGVMDGFAEHCPEEKEKIGIALGVM
jgi:hypothetical protein